LTELRLIRTGSVDERHAGTTTARQFGTARMVEDWTLPWILRSRLLRCGMGAPVEVRLRRLTS